MPHSVVTGPINSEILSFIDRAIGSVEELEILLLLKADPDRRWNPEEISHELRSSEMSVMKRLRCLVDSGLVTPTTGTTYRYGPTDSRVDDLINGLVTAYKDFRVRVIERIYSKPDSLRTFADAFRIRKEGE